MEFDYIVCYLIPCKFGGKIIKDFRSKLITNLYELGYKNLEKHPR